ncbi:2-oxoglutarate dehydrogenase, E2 component, dihydrolipoamide succinyltransferase [Nocardioides sp. J54]|uniref:2-oxoglutarate dehydrogenase, E2 component, dihydrolipoamide succinyltransferase n=1 Tax=Nocardioides sp. J54 TaxID=935866 RepID=UPI000491A41D|nr:2-oxoglutarate dehydrogenase, E2 component, dihydrolipoamide succinyltransferase [Nocardioides sp. J54]
MADVMMPRLGVSVTEGTVSTWLKEIGDEVAVGEAICEVSTDKVDTEIESTVAGIVAEQRYAEGEVVAVGEVLAVVTTDEDAAPPAVPTPEPAPVSTPVSTPAPEPASEAAPAADAGDAGRVLMPRLGVSVTEGTVSTWLKEIGDEVAVGEAICEVSTDKVDTEIESTVAGVLAQQLHAEGEVVLVGEPLALVTPTGAVGAAPAAAPPGTERVTADPQANATAPAPAAPAAPAAVPGEPAVVGSGPFDHEAAIARVLAGATRSGRPAASPAARRLATELGVDVAQVTGTGGGGHITRADVQRRASDWPESPQPPVAAPAAVRTAPVRPVPEPASTEAIFPPGYEDVPFEAVPTSRIRRVTAEHMVRSRRTAAHMTTEVDVDLGRLSEVRATLNAQRQQSGQAKLSFLPFIARAACAALLDHPDLNATFETERLLRWREVNLGIAVDTPRGLMVPVVRGAERLTVESLGRAIVDVAARVRDGKADPDDFRAGTFTISNPGSVGAVSAPAIINQPQVGILGMPTIVRRPWVVRLADGQETIAIRPIIRLALTFDHRAVDGADATRCLVAVRERLEAWGVDDYR